MALIEPWIDPANHDTLSAEDKDNKLMSSEGLEATEAEMDAMQEGGVEEGLEEAVMDF